jgi:hypothetical protein
VAAVSKAEEARLIELIAIELAEIGRRENSDVLFYAEAGAGWMAGSVFFSRSDTIVWNSPNDADLGLLVRKLWFAAPEGPGRWKGMTMTVSGDKFRVSFDYGEDWNNGDDEGDRREPIVRAHFGDKPIYYPPLEGAEPWPGK